jgi:hypothetical protein
MALDDAGLLIFLRHLGTAGSPRSNWDPDPGRTSLRTSLPNSSGTKTAAT